MDFGWRSILGVVMVRHPLGSIASALSVQRVSSVRPRCIHRFKCHSPARLTSLRASRRPPLLRRARARFRSSALHQVVNHDADAVPTALRFRSKVRVGRSVYRRPNGNPRHLADQRSPVRTFNQALHSCPKRHVLGRSSASLLKQQRIRALWRDRILPQASTHPTNAATHTQPRRPRYCCATRAQPARHRRYTFVCATATQRN